MEHLFLSFINFLLFFANLLFVGKRMIDKDCTNDERLWGAFMVTVLFMAGMIQLLAYAGEYL